MLQRALNVDLPLVPPGHNSYSLCHPRIYMYARYLMLDALNTKCNRADIGGRDETASLTKSLAAHSKATAIQMKVIAVGGVVVGAEHAIKKAARTAAHIAQELRLFAGALPIA